MTSANGSHQPAGAELPEAFQTVLKLILLITFMGLRQSWSTHGVLIIRARRRPHSAPPPSSTANKVKFKPAEQDRHL